MQEDYNKEAFMGAGGLSSIVSSNNTTRSFCLKEKVGLRKGSD